MPLSDYIDEQLLRRLFLQQASFPLPTDVYVALFTGAPTKSGGGTEVAGFGYARAQVPATITYWNVSGPIWQVSNVLKIDFGQASGGAWGTIVSGAVFDAASGGNMLWFEDLLVPMVVSDGDPAVINILGLTIVGVS